MQLGLDSHKVSLTKNGYFKLIELIRKYPKDEILDHIDEIRLDRTQGRKMLAGNSNEVLPNVWDEAKKLDESSQEALLLFSIIFSHADLIQIFQNSRTGEMTGVLKRSDIDGKVYTNLAYALNKAGLAIDFTEGAAQTRFDLSPIFTRNEIGPLAKKILEAHLRNMGWKGTSKEDPFERTFEEQVAAYKFNDVFGVSRDQFNTWLEGTNVERIESRSGHPTDLLQMFSDKLRTAGLVYSEKLIGQFIGSLLTKPFVILCGLSGSGKTKLAQAFAAWLCEDKSQYTIVAVGSDWTNREPLLGFPNALNNSEYIKPDSAVLDLILLAISNPKLPYFIILDEMNLSHVERYFADFLSAMESSEPILLYSGSSRGIPQQISLPPNLFIVGTVNIDETTNMFSPKVLDRANTIEFRLSLAEIRSFLDMPRRIDLTALQSQGSSIGESFLELAHAKTTEVSKVASETLVDFFEPLKNAGAEFGYRTAYEINKLLNNLSIIHPGLTDLEKIDIALMQKLLPKLHGSRRKLAAILIVLAKLCVTDSVKDVEKEIFSSNNGFEYDSKVLVKYPLTLEKIARMYKNLMSNGFASFAEA